VGLWPELIAEDLNRFLRGSPGVLWPVA